MKSRLILDGATGTELQRAGMPQGASPELWILENPEVITAIQSRYAAAGSDIVYAPTFGASRIKLQSFGAGEKVSEINKELIRLSKNTAGDEVKVAGDLAPCGLFIAPFGDYSMENLIDIYLEQATALESAGVSLYVIETCMTIAEARAAFIAVRRVSQKPIFVTFTCEKNGKTMTGADTISALVIFQAMGAAAFGLNCSTGPDEMLENIKRLTPYAAIPLIAKPNAGLPEMTDGLTNYNMSPEEFVKNVPELARAGVSIFGGCCGTTDKHIVRLSEVVSALPDDLFKVKAVDTDYISNERTVIKMSDAVFSESELRCDDALEDDLTELTDVCARVRVESIDDAAVLEKSQYAAQNPIYIACDDSEALEAALVSYNGRAAVSSKLESGVLKPLCEKYGAIIMDI